MRILTVALLLLCSYCAWSQEPCASSLYQSALKQNNPSAAANFAQAESKLAGATASREMGTGYIVRIPVVFHVLYHDASQKLTNEQIQQQLTILNNCFRRRSADTSRTPSVFKNLAADCEIEFALATVTPQRRSTSGIVNKYTPLTIWEMNDKMKFSSEMGDDAWDSENYLNIWVCALRSVSGYSSTPGSERNLDGVVLSFAAFNSKVAVHEVGHWMGLKHIWGDQQCGDDLVYDTPTQSTYTSGCPSGTRLSSVCGSGSNGDMYMNYMDFTADGCTNMFTYGQKDRMRSSFGTGAYHAAMLRSYGFDRPAIEEIPVPDGGPRWLKANLFPNPATNQLWLDVAYDARWVGITLNIYSVQGQILQQVVIKSTVQEINITQLNKGVYILYGRNNQGEEIRAKFLKN